MAILAFIPARASAHVVKTDGSVGVELHISPSDDPVAGTPSTLGFSIADSTGRFLAPACTCVLSVSENGRTVSQQTLAAADALSSGVILLGYTFPHQAVYTVSLQGTPRRAGVFRSFRVDYEVRVDRGVKKSPGSNANLWLIFGLLTMVWIVIGVMMMQEIHRTKHRRRF